MKIIVRIQGGTGNQLFQYAFGRGVATNLSRRLNRPVELLIDKSVCDNTRWDPHKIHRKYSLGLFNTKVKFAKNSDFFGFIWLRKHYKFFNKFYDFLRFKKFFFPFYYPEQTFAYDENILLRKKNTYYDGYWQTEKYFKHIADDIRAEITSVIPLSKEMENIRQKIKVVNAVSLHIRRGDYIADNVATNYHGICSLEYYKNAIAYIEKHVNTPNFFIFSDDYAWAVENFKFIKNPVICINSSEASDYEDLALMRECKHHIISNSSFGWWGAWLNPRKDKIVIGPKAWFRNAPKADTRDTFPEEWKKF